MPWAHPRMTASDVGAPGLRAVARDDKVLATLQARAALAGYELVRLADDSFLAARSGLPETTCALADVDQVGAWLAGLDDSTSLRLEHVDPEAPFEAAP